MESESTASAVENGYAKDVCGQQVAGELDALEVQTEQSGEEVGERRLAHTWNILDEQMTAREQGRESQFQCLPFAQDDLIRRAQQRADREVMRGLLSHLL